MEKIVNLKNERRKEMEKRSVILVALKKGKGSFDDILTRVKCK